MFFLMMLSQGSTHHHYITKQTASERRVLHFISTPEVFLWRSILISSLGSSLAWVHRADTALLCHPPCLLALCHLKVKGLCFLPHVKFRYPNIPVEYSPCTHYSSTIFVHSYSTHGQAHLMVPAIFLFLSRHVHPFLGSLVKAFLRLGWNRIAQGTVGTSKKLSFCCSVLFSSSNKCRFPPPALKRSFETSGGLFIKL